MLSLLVIRRSEADDDLRSMSRRAAERGPERNGFVAFLLVQTYPDLPGRDP